MEIREAAARLSVEETEIRSVTDHECGVIIETVDGVKTIDISPETPDADGKVGLAFFERPDGRDIDDPEAPAYAFPVFRPFLSVEVDEDDDGSEDGEDLDALSVAMLRARVVDLVDAGDLVLDADVKVTKLKKAELVELLTSVDEDEDDDGSEDGDESEVEHVTEPAPAP